MSSKKVQGLLAVGVLALATLGVGSYLVHRNASASSASCRLTVPRSTIDPIVFPERAGAAELDAAIIGDADGTVIQRLIQERGGFSVAHGTACSELERGPVYSRVLVTEGPSAGRQVWAPSLHTSGN